MWMARDLTLFGRVLITKSLGFSKIIHSISNVEVPDGIAGGVIEFVHFHMEIF